jgi:hypothetical protein
MPLDEIKTPLAATDVGTRDELTAAALPARPGGGIFANELFSEERGLATILIPCGDTIRPMGGGTGCPAGKACMCLPRLGKGDTPNAALWAEASVFEAANIREWRGHDVVDAEGHKIGRLEAVYVDTSTDLPSFGTVKIGLPTRQRLAFVPLDQATVGPGYLRVRYARKQVKDAPSIDTDGELPAADEEAIFQHYGLTYQAGADGERRLARR